MREGNRALVAKFNSLGFKKQGDIHKQRGFHCLSFWCGSNRVSTRFFFPHTSQQLTLFVTPPTLYRTISPPYTIKNVLRPPTHHPFRTPPGHPRPPPNHPMPPPVYPNVRTRRPVRGILVRTVNHHVSQFRPNPGNVHTVSARRGVVCRRQQLASRIGVGARENPARATRSHGNVRTLRQTNGLDVQCRDHCGGPYAVAIVDLSV